MLKKHIILFESKDYGWIAYLTTGADATRTLTVNNKYSVFYIFECNLELYNPYNMKLKAPLHNHYDCKRINKYRELNFEENDKYIILTLEGNREEIWYDVKQN